MKALSMAALGLLLVIIIVVSAFGAYKEHFQNPTQGGCACDNYNNGENAPGSPTYQCYAEYGSDGVIVPTCNQTAEGKLPNEQDCKTGCRRKYCKWGDADGIAVCMNQDGPPGPGPVGPNSKCIYAQPPEMPTCAQGCELTDSSKNRIKCYATMSDAGGMNLCACLVQGVDADTDQQACSACPSCYYCISTSQCMSKSDYRKGKCPGATPPNPNPNPNPNPSPTPNPIPNPPAPNPGPSTCGSIMGKGDCRKAGCKFCDSVGVCMSNYQYEQECSASPSPTPDPGSSSTPSGPSSSTASSKQKKSNLLRDIRDIVHNELMLERGMTSAGAQPLFQTASQGSTLGQEDVSPALYQGQEMGQRPKWCPKNMDDYIRKDSIPCYGCTLDY